jgi:hypothetical protein
MCYWQGCSLIKVNIKAVLKLVCHSLEACAMAEGTSVKPDGVIQASYIKCSFSVVLFAINKQMARAIKSSFCVSLTKVMQS